jgi:hypothetical protein
VYNLFAGWDTVLENAAGFAETRLARLVKARSERVRQTKHGIARFNRPVAKEGIVEGGLSVEGNSQKVRPA